MAEQAAENLNAKIRIRDLTYQIVSVYFQKGKLEPTSIRWQ